MKGAAKDSSEAGPSRFPSVNWMRQVAQPLTYLTAYLSACRFHPEHLHQVEVAATTTQLSFFLEPSFFLELSRLTDFDISLLMLSLSKI